MKVAISFIVTFALFVAPALASITAVATSEPGSEPTSNVEISQTTISAYLTDPTPNPNGNPFEAVRKTANSGGAWREVGQTFTVESTFTLDKISLMVSQSDQFPASGLSLYMDVYNAGGNVNAHNGTSLAGYPDTATMPTIPTHATAPTGDENIVWMTFDVPNVELSQEVGVYGFRLGLDYEDFTINYQLGSSSLDVGGIYLNRNGNPYAGGKMFRYHPATGAVVGLGTPDDDGLGESDLVFILQSPPEGGNPGDFDGDGDADAADYVAWRKTEDTPAWYTDWYTNFGADAGGAGPIADAGIATVPEPSVIALVSFGVLGVMGRRRRMDDEIRAVGMTH